MGNCFWILPITFCCILSLSKVNLPYPLMSSRLLIHLMLLTLTIMTQPSEQNSEAGKGKSLCWSLFFTKLEAFRPATLLKKRQKEAPTQVFPGEIWGTLKNNCFAENLWTTDSVYWLLYHILILTMHYGICFSFLQITSSLSRNWNNKAKDAWSSFSWRSISLNEIFSFWKLKISFTKMFHESLKKTSLIGI